MDNDKLQADISKTELNLLINALTKSVDMNYSKRFFWFALVLAFFIGMAAAYISIPVKRFQRSETAKLCLEESDEIKNRLYGLDLKVENLVVLTDSIIKKQEDTKKYQQSETRVEKKKSSVNNITSNNDGNKLQTLDNVAYTVTIHYNAENDKKIIENISEFLKRKKYNVPNIQKVKYKKNDMRYFHKEDEAAAIVLRNEVRTFINENTDVKNINLNLIDLEKAYPQAPEGLIELWINLF